VVGADAEGAELANPIACRVARSLLDDEAPTGRWSA
jgi:hypothetical protein